MKLNERNNYILKFGIIRWGLLGGILYSLINLFIDGFAGFKPFIVDTIMNIVLFSIAGYFLGLITWKLTYKKKSNH